jgi:two-component system, chemotaxis family, protein-glutamate methylesterase/glutaminase
MSSEQSNQHFIVVIGTSAGGLNALSELVSQLRPGMGASYFVVMHLSRKGVGEFLVHRLKQATSLPCEIATDGEPIRPDRIYLAPPNHHLLVTKDSVLIGSGPPENRWRPSIDVLFRSAAAAHNGHTVGIVLTGLLDDGTSGMISIKKSGGTCIVQDPNQAEYPDMPLAVLNATEVDHCVSLSEMGAVLQEICGRSRVDRVPVPDDIIAEAQIARRMATGIDKVQPLGEHSVYACPDCGGGLWHITEDNFNRYRCHIGHSYSEKDLVIKQVEMVESTLWVALRMMEERKRLLLKLQNESTTRGFMKMSEGHKQAGEEMEHHINQLKELLYNLQNTQEV